MILEEKEIPIDACRGLGEALDLTQYFDEQDLRHWGSYLHAGIGELCPRLMQTCLKRLRIPPISRSHDFDAF
ncbi:MAG: hypothetical protein Rhob2KO_53550 [Rhodopirellula baltica]